MTPDYKHPALDVGIDYNVVGALISSLLAFNFFSSFDAGLEPIQRLLNNHCTMPGAGWLGTRLG